MHPKQKIKAATPDQISNRTIWRDTLISAVRVMAVKDDARTTKAARRAAWQARPRGKPLVRSGTKLQRNMVVRDADGTRLGKLKFTDHDALLRQRAEGTVRGYVRVRSKYNIARLSA